MKILADDDFDIPHGSPGTAFQFHGSNSVRNQAMR